MILKIVAALFDRRIPCGRPAAGFGRFGRLTASDPALQKRRSSTAATEYRFGSRLYAPSHAAYN
jgi:hypothetical protein